MLSVFGVVSPLPQPVNTALMTTPNSTISANILFIVAVTFTKSAKRTSTIFRLGLATPGLLSLSKAGDGPVYTDFCFGSAG